MMMLTCLKKFKLQTINLGLKMFQKNKESKSDGKYRLLQEGLEILVPHMDGRRIIEVPTELFEKLTVATSKTLNFDTIAAQFSDTIANKFKSIPMGSAVLKFSNMHCPEANFVTIWIGRNNVLLMIGKEEIKSLTLHVGARE